MKRPCETDDFLAVLCGEIESDFDDYRIQDSVIEWVSGNYIAALSEISDDGVRRLCGDRVIIRYDDDVVSHLVKNRFRVIEVAE